MKLESKVEKSANYFKNGFNCSQAVLATFASDFGLSEEYVFKGKEDCEDVHNRGDALPLFAHAFSFTHRDF